jgi:predicted PhzF superfamily epimerase YddE/YHI9
MKLPFYQVDAFATKPFTGNPAAVVFCEPDFPGKTMQSIAAENNLAETAFVYRSSQGLGIRWFTPTVEVDFCGHAILATGHVLFNHQALNADIVSFSSRSGGLHVRKRADLLWLDFPSDKLEEVVPPGDLLKGLATPVEQVYRGRDDYLAIVDDESCVRAIKPEMQAVSRLPFRGVIVSSKGDAVDFVSRFFAPQSGIPEDPVTGSAHTSLIPYWSQRLNKQDMVAQQVSEPGGNLFCRYQDDRVELGGHAVTFLVEEISL